MGAFVVVGLKVVGDRVGDAVKGSNVINVLVTGD
jgi:hypothetical protein